MISELLVQNYKSISEEARIEIRPLTILAGANSSGKSSFMQPLLLLKQTLEASYDPGALLLNGPNVRLTSTDQLFPLAAAKVPTPRLRIGVGVSDGRVITTDLVPWNDSEPLRVMSTSCIRGQQVTEINADAPTDRLPPGLSKATVDTWFRHEDLNQGTWPVTRNRCFLEQSFVGRSGGTTSTSELAPGRHIEKLVTAVIHLPGLRGNPARTYPLTAVGPSFPGTFENYVASIVANWQSLNGAKELKGLNNDLQALGLTWKVSAQRRSHTEIELLVGRLPKAARGGAQDLVSIADVGFGVSQVLPVLVSLHCARDGQLVFIEQPELHLHPRAQCQLAGVLSNAAQRGIQVVVETHSALLILGIQSLIAEGVVPPGLVKLHWFARRSDGATRIRSADLDEAGAFGDWPEDFAEVGLEAERRYLDAAEARHARS